MTVDHPLDGATTEKHKKSSYASDYFQTSSFVHCSLPAIGNHVVEEGTPFKLSTWSGHHATTQSTLFTVLIYLHSTICYAMYGMNSESPKTAKMFQRTLNSMKPYERGYGKKLP
jgi:hypothetical protein